jgi:hypothetical protein
MISYSFLPPAVEEVKMSYATSATTLLPVWTHFQLVARDLILLIWTALVLVTTLA